MRVFRYESFLSANISEIVIVGLVVKFAFASEIYSLNFAANIFWNSWNNNCDVTEHNLITAKHVLIHRNDAIKFRKLFRMIDQFSEINENRYSAKL